jgi:energy-coupling factor transporter ATP-binding protein EcfA2
MRLKEFRVRNYRSVNDSGPIRVDQRIALVGRNESGKTNLLVALACLNPPEGMEELSFVKDFPRDREVADFHRDLRVVDTVWELSKTERAALADVFARAAGISEVTVGRAYRPVHFVGFRGLPPVAVDMSLVKRQFAKVNQSIRGALRQRGEATVEVEIEAALELLSEALEDSQDPIAWAPAAKASLAQFRGTLETLEFPMPKASDAALVAIADHADAIVGDRDAQSRAMEWVIERLPRFIYLNDIPELEGHQNMADLIRRLDEERPTKADANFLKLARVAGFDPREVAELGEDHYERRQQLVNRAGATLTRKLRRLWSDRPLKIRFNLDADHFDTLVSDPTAAYDVEVNLNERSRGFRWFFSLYISLAADTASGEGENAVLLLDEPGLHLHALGQRDLLDHFAKNFRNQVIFATHSPFMIPVEEPATIRTVAYDSEAGTTCSNRPSGDARTLYPIQVALAYSAEEGLFGEQPLLMVATMSDFLYLNAMSAHAKLREREGLPDDIAIVPMGGLDRATYMLSTLADDTEGILLLVNDCEPRWRVLKALLPEDAPVARVGEFVAQSHSEGQEGGAGLEDLLDPDVYAELVRAIYGKQLRRKKLTLDQSIPGIAKRYQQALAKSGIVFDPIRVAVRFMGAALKMPEEVICERTEARFDALFERIRSHLA